MPDIATYRLSDDGDIPNNASLPLIVFKGALSPSEDDIRARFQGNGWGGAWVDGIYDFHHYHSTAHEILGIAAGSADVQFGGRGGPVLTLTAGDAVLIPAGVGHCRVSEAQEFSVVGAYPDGQDWDLRREGDPEREAIRGTIAAVPLPRRDPVLGLAWAEFARRL